MTLYDIDQAIAALVDPETGELMDYEAFDALSMERDRKLENMALVLKNAKASSVMLKAEIDALTSRKRVADNTVKRMKEYLDQALGGEKFESARCAISYRKSEATEVDTEFVAWARKNCADVLIEQAPSVDKTSLKEKLRDGMDCPYARIVENRNIQVR